MSRELMFLAVFLTIMLVCFLYIAYGIFTNNNINEDIDRYMFEDIAKQDISHTR